MSIPATSLQEVRTIDGINCVSGLPERVTIYQGKIEKVTSLTTTEDLPYIGLGLLDMQVNGIDGIDFNDIKLRPIDVIEATKYLLSKGVTTFFPTLITNSDENIFQLLETIRLAAESDELVHACIGGVHLEGPFISTVEGARGAHNLQFIKAPDWQWVQTCQEVSGNRIRLLTLSPEWENVEELIRMCTQQAIRVAIGHSYASPEEIRGAVNAGATLSTHLGNAVPLMLPRHPNLLWEQLAQDELYASIIADGFHLPDAFLKVVIRTKGDKAILVSDATCFSGMAPGIYQTHIGDEVILEKGGRLAMKKSPDLLAGATKCLIENVEYLAAQGLTTLGGAWKMASANPAIFLGKREGGLRAGQPADLVVFRRNKQEKIQVSRVFKNGQVAFEI